jgi:ankyrin repeat protein
MRPAAELEQSLVDECVGNAHGNLDRVRELVEEHSALAGARASWGESPVDAATQMGRRDTIEYLVSRGAPVDFFTACVLGRREQVESELSRDPSLVRGRGVHDLPALYFPAISGNLELVELLVSRGADVNDAAQAAAPIHGAVMGGHTDVVRWLLERGADPSLPDYQGRSARELALAMDRPELAALLP